MRSTDTTRPRSISSRARTARCSGPPRSARVPSTSASSGPRTRIPALMAYQRAMHLHHTGENELVWPLLLSRIDQEANMVLRMEAQHEVVARTLAEASRRMPDWRSAPSAATATPLVSALTEHRNALL